MEFDMIYLNILLLLFCFTKINDIGQLIDRGEIKENGGQSLDYTFVLNKYDQPILITITSNDEHTLFSIYDSLHTIHKKIKVKGIGFSRLRSFSYPNKLYCFLGQLFTIDLENFQLSIQRLAQDNYRYLKLVEFSGDTCLMASSFYKIHIYSWPDCQLISEILRNEYRQFDKPICVDSLIIYQNKDNELTIYNSRKSKTIRSFNAGTESGYFLGFNLGIFNDKITTYEIAREQGDIILYYMTSTGSLFKVNPVTGDTLHHIYRFRGSENNAGLISSLQIVDINSDGVKDLIGPSVDQNLYCINGADLSMLWEFDTGYENQMPVSLYDFNQDKISDVINVNDAMILTVLNGKSGEKILQHKLKDHNYQTTVGIVNLNQSEYPYLVLNYDSGTIKFFEITSVSQNKNGLLWLPGR